MDTENPENKKNVLIITADAGFGHRSAANAILSALKKNYDNELNMVLLNPLDHEDTPAFLRDTQSDYDVWVKNLPELYRFGYELTDGNVTTAILESILTFFLAEVMKKILIKYEPDLVISTYPLYQAPLKSAMDDLDLVIPIITVLTDLSTLHSIWFHPHVDLTIVPNNLVEGLALNNGIEQKKIFVCGIPINPDISKYAGKKDELRMELNWEKDKTTVLCVGSSRMENFNDMVDVLNHSGFDIQLVLVAGNDEELFEQFSNTTWHHPAHLYRFTEEMPKFLLSADMILCKAGGLIVTESLGAGLPLLLVDVIPGQETGNAQFVEDHEAGYWIKTPLDILKCFSHLAADDYSLLKKMQNNARKAGNPHAAEQIAGKVYEMVCET